MRRLREVIEAGQFAVTVECEPPKGADVTTVLSRTKALLGRIHGINVTDNQAAVMRMSSLAMCRLLYEQGHDPVLQLTTRDRNRLALQSDLLGAHALGIRNVLCLRGDDPTVGDHKDAKPVFDLDAAQLLGVVNGLNNGKDLAGNALKGATDFFPAAAVSPEMVPPDQQLAGLEKKMAAGARFFQTQAVYNPDRFGAFMEKARPLGARILAGIVVLKSAKMAEYMNKNIPGISVPQPLIDELAAADKEQALGVGIEIAVRLIGQIRGMCHGVHIMAVGADQAIPEILSRANLG
ncbi:MAG TPA: methylenetetrahydrofolate reductase [Nitrospiria bacterium]|nr:methylenetetrahydrofolate reductase [Nitrospiria bacterium]